MMKLYKLTDKDDQTYDGCQWGPGVTVETSGEGELCGNGFTHWYTDPLLAVFLNPIHADFDLKEAHLWEGEGEAVKNDHGLKVGCVKATTIKRIKKPTVTVEQRVRFGILCALAVCKDAGFVEWAEKWLNGEDRTAATAAEAMERAEWAATEATAAAAAEAMERAEWAATEATARARRAALSASWAAARAAAEATEKNIDLIKLAKQAVS